MAWEGDDEWAIPTIATRGNLASPDCLPSIFAYPKIDKWNQQLEALKLADGYVAMDRDKEIWWWNKVPRINEGDNYWTNGKEYFMLKDAAKIFGLPIPKYEGDWKKSLRQIKNHKVVAP